VRPGPKFPNIGTPLGERELKEDFDVWWHQTYFRTDHPYRAIYKKLYEAGADLEYIDGLTRILRVVDQNTLDLKTELKTLIPAHLRSLTHPPALKKRIEKMVRDYAKRKRLTFKQTDLNEIKKDVEARLRQEILARLEVDKNRYLERAKNVARTNPMGSILFLYGGTPFLYQTGRRSDNRGSFFLLAVTEHLRNKSGKPRFLLAVNLLRAVRGQKSIWSKSLRLQAMVRVNKFTTSGHDWKRHLKLVQESYESFRSGNPTPRFIATEQTLAAFQEVGDVIPTFER